MDTDPTTIVVGIVLWAFAVSSPLWTLVAFAAYAIGRRQYSVAMLLALLTVEGASIALAVVVYGMAMTAKE